MQPTREVYRISAQLIWACLVLAAHQPLPHQVKHVSSFDYLTNEKSLDHKFAVTAAAYQRVQPSCAIPEGPSKAAAVPSCR